MSEAPRHLARIVVLQTLYATEHAEQELDDAFDAIANKEGLKEKNRKFALELLHEVIGKIQWADEHIAALAENWKIERIAFIDKVIMRMAMTELSVFIDVPVKVVLNEAIELAKEFSTNKSSKFINGILDNFVKKQNQPTQE